MIGGDIIQVFTVSGKAQHGKDTVANLLYEELRNAGESALITHNADLLKFICKQYFSWDGQKNEKGRGTLQYVGTDVVRKQRPDFWVDFIIDVLKLFDKEWDWVIIPDARFPNEIDRLREEGFKVSHLRVERPAYNSNLTKEQQAHPSETALDDVIPDELIVNDGSIDDLRCKIQKLLTRYTHEENK